MKPRYKELKYKGNTYTKRHQIDKILLENDFGWLIDGEVENLRIEIEKDTLIVNSGIIYNCVFEYGVIRDADVRNINFKDGVIYNGVFKYFEIEKGIIFNGTFLKGNIKFADIRGGQIMPTVNVFNQVERDQAKQEEEVVQGQKLSENIMITKYDDYVSEKFSINNIFKPKSKIKEELISDVTNTLEDFKEYVINLPDINKQTLKEEVKKLKLDFSKKVVNKLNIDIFIKGIYDVQIKKDNREENIKEYFDDYYKSLPNKVELYMKNIKPDYTGDEEFSELKTLKSQQLIKIPEMEFAKYKRIMQIELLKAQEWLKDTDNRVAIVFEGRDAAGKGSAIKTITEYLDPKYINVATFGIPSEEDKEDWFGRYEDELPEPGKITLYDRSWYNRAVNDPVMGYCTEEEYRDFMDNVVPFEQHLIDSGIILIKFWFSIEKETQLLRFELRKKNPLKYWKYSPNDEKTIPKYDLFTKYKEQMFNKTSTDNNPWVVLDSNDKKVAQLNSIRYILQNIPYENKNLKILLQSYPEFIHVMK